MDDFSFLCTTQASQNFMAKGLGTLKVHTTHVLVDFFKTLVCNLCFMIMVVVVYVPFFIFNIEKIEIETVRLRTKLKILQNDFSTQWSVNCI